MKPSIVVYKKELSKDLIDELKEDYQVSVFDKLKLADPEVIKALKNCVGIVGWGGRIGEELIQKAPNLKVVSTISVGYDHCDVPLLSKNKIALMHTPHVLTDAVADTAMGLVLATARRLVELDQLVRQGLWTTAISSEYYGLNVYGKTLGIVGMGRIGSAIAERAHLGFRMPILYNSRSQHKNVEDKLSAKWSDLDELLVESDFICNVLPSTPQTHHFFNKDKFKLMKKDSIFINIGRGATVDEQALIEALDSKKLFGAGLDVFEKEPLPLDSPFIGRSDVVILPHIGSATRETRRAMDILAVKNLVSALNGDISKNCVNDSDLN